jgi:hypothetical protein
MNNYAANLFLIPMGFGSAWYLRQTYDPSDPFGMSNATEILPSIRLFLKFCLSYFIIDTVFLIKKNLPHERVYFVHHAIGAISIIYVTWFNTNAIKFVLGYLTYELSTIFWRLTQETLRNRDKSVYAICIQSVFFLSYTITRIIFGTYLTIYAIPFALTFDGYTKILVLLPITLQSLIYYWYYRIIRKIILVFGNKIPVVKKD